MLTTLFSLLKNKQTKNQPKLKCLADVPKIFHLWTEPLTIFKKPIINKS